MPYVSEEPSSNCIYKLKFISDRGGIMDNWGQVESLREIYLLDRNNEHHSEDMREN